MRTSARSISSSPRPIARFATLTTGLRKDLKLYREIAAACMGLRRSRRDDVDRAVAGLRDVEECFPPPRRSRSSGALTVEYANGCERLNREKVEMLLLALEILLKPGVEPEPDSHSAADATRMMAVLGETTKVGSHPELTKYFERFQQIASDVATLLGSLRRVRQTNGRTEIYGDKIPGSDRRSAAGNAAVLHRDSPREWP